MRKRRPESLRKARRNKQRRLAAISVYASFSASFPAPAAGPCCSTTARRISRAETAALVQTELQALSALRPLPSAEKRAADEDIRVYRDNISLDFLRDTAYIAMTFADEDGRRQPTLTAHTGLTPGEWKEKNL